MPYFRSCVLVASLFAISSAQANVNTTTEVDENPNTLQSLPLLQSLRNINQQKLDYRAPYVHDLNNRYQVRTLFVETQDLPILDIQLTLMPVPRVIGKLKAAYTAWPIWPPSS